MSYTVLQKFRYKLCKCLRRSFVLIYLQHIKISGSSSADGQQKDQYALSGDKYPIWKD